MPKELKYYKERLSALRNAIADLLEEMEKATPATPPRKRRSNKQDVMREFEAMYEYGIRRKPEHLKKKNIKAKNK